MKLIEFIKVELLESACSQTGTEDELALAVLICARFCEKTFGFEECKDNSSDVTTFCATTICLAGSRMFEGKNGEFRNFSIKADLHNELTSACINGFEPLRITGYIRQPKKKQVHRLRHMDKDEVGIISADYFKTATPDESDREDLFSFLTPTEKLIIYALDGDMQMKPIMRGFNLKQSEAKSLIRVITNKIKANF